MLENYFSQYDQLITPKSYTNKSFSSNANLKSSQNKDDYFELFNREWKMNLNLKQENVKMKKTINELSKQVSSMNKMILEKDSINEKNAEYILQLEKIITKIKNEKIKKQDNYNFKMSYESSNNDDVNKKEIKADVEVPYSWFFKYNKNQFSYSNGGSNGICEYASLS